MAKYLVIVESPAKAKTIKKYLGSNYKVEASIGHIRDLPKSKLGVDLEKDFEPKYITIRGKGDILAKLKKEAKKVDKVYLATDPDREGEAISWHLADILKVEDKTKCRITFNEITKMAVKKAISKPTKIDMNLVDAQQARRVLDRIVGYKISPMLWRKVKKGLSAGRVQSIATKLICDREVEIENFKEEEYWSLVATLKGGKNKKFNAKFYGDKNGRVELEKQEQVLDIVSKIQGNDFQVKNVKKSERTKKPLAPFTTSTLQQESHRKLGFATKKTMMVAQQLYEGVDVKGKGTTGLVTYIRTDSTRISDEACGTVRDYIQEVFGEKYLNPDVRVYKNKSASQDAHEAIRPSYPDLDPESIKDSLSREQYKLYKLIWSRFVASQMKNAVYDTVNVELEVKDFVFKATGSKIKFDGFLTAYSIEKEGKEEDKEDTNLNLPDLEKGDRLKCDKLDPKQHFTQPPPRFTEASLVKILEENGVGRPSTYAPTINTILIRGYVEKKQKVLYPTELGKIVDKIMKDHFKDIVDMAFTAQMEKDLDSVEEGQKQWVQIIRDFYGDFKGVLEEAEVNIEEIQIKDQEAGIICEKCGRMMVYKLGRKGKKFIACPGFPECRNAIPIMEHAHAKCPKCDGDLYFKDSKKGRKFLGCGSYPDCDFMSWDKPAGKDCPVCGKALLVKTKAKQDVEYCGNEACEYGKEEKQKDAKDKNAKDKNEDNKKGQAKNKTGAKKATKTKAKPKTKTKSKSKASKK